MRTKRLTFSELRSTALRKGALALCVILLVVALGVSADEDKPTIITFDASGAGTGAFEGTFPFAISDRGAIAGFYLDASNVYHGFLRARPHEKGDEEDESPTGATFNTFEAPGADTTAGSFNGTFAFSINSAGAIAGEYVDASSVSHGFLRARDGTFTTFEAPGADTTAGSFNGTFAFSINSAGAIAGEYVDASSVSHGFLRARDGTFTTFDAPGAGTGAFQGTIASNINPAGTIEGVYIDASGADHDFVRAPDGAITTVDAPGAGTGPGQGTFACTRDCLNPAGTITGPYADASFVIHGFVRAPDGAITTFDAPGAGTGAFQGTFPEGINRAGRIAGEYVDASNVSHGFLRAPDGTFTTFDVSGAGTGSGQGTIPNSNNAADAITGYYVDASNVAHGFLRTAPRKDD